MSENFSNNIDAIRSDAEMSELINGAITEVIELFGTEMDSRDKVMLQSVIDEKNTDARSRLLYLLQMPRSASGISEQFRDYINQILMTLRKIFTEKEQKVFGGINKNMLDEI